MTKSDKNNTPKGDCFEAVAKFIQRPEITDWPDDYRLVHGNIAKLRQDESVNHAWIEENDFVLEVSCGRNMRFSKDLYLKTNRVTNIRRYTVLEALKLISKYGHWGPWD